MSWPEVFSHRKYFPVNGAHKIFFNLIYAVKFFMQLSLHSVKIPLCVYVFILYVHIYLRMYVIYIHTFTDMHKDTWWGNSIAMSDGSNEEISPSLNIYGTFM